VAGRLGGRPRKQRTPAELAAQQAREGRRVLSVRDHPTQPFREIVSLACGHDLVRARRPKPPTRLVICTKCEGIE
jgi:hypothetical protein